MEIYVEIKNETLFCLDQIANLKTQKERHFCMALKEHLCFQISETTLAISQVCRYLILERRAGHKPHRPRYRVTDAKTK